MVALVAGVKTSMADAPSVRLPFHLQGTPGTIGKTEASRLAGRTIAPAKRTAEAGEHKLRRSITAIGLVLVEELLDNDRLGLIDDHAPCGVTIGLQAWEHLDTTSQSARKATQGASSKAVRMSVFIRTCVGRCAACAWRCALR